MPGPIIVVGFVPVALASLAEFRPERSVIVVEEPDVVRKRDVKAKIAEAPVVSELIEWEYQLAGAADEFFVTHAGLRPAAVAPLQEYPTLFAARLAERYGLPGAGLGAAALLRDKALLRKVARAAGIRNPASEPVDGPADVRAFMAAHPGPVVLKPANRQAAVGAMILHSADEVEAAWRQCTLQDEGVMVPDRPFPLRMLVEAYVAGEEYSVEMLLRDGVPLFSNVTGKDLYPGPCPVERGHVAPAGVPASLARQLEEQTHEVLRAVGFASGVVHCEWIVTDGEPCLVECAGRFAGDGIIELIERAYPVELVRSFYAVLMGEPAPALPAEASEAAAVRFLHAEPGVVESVDGLDEARALEGVVSCDVSVQPGDRVRELRNSWDRVGSVIVLAPTAAAASARAAEAIERIRVKTRAAP